jgi:hypothetical protein
MMIMIVKIPPMIAIRRALRETGAVVDCVF